MKRFLALLFAFLLLAPLYAQAADAIRILLFGTDISDNQLSSEAGKMSRADVILVLAFQPELPGIRVLSIERDYLVELPDGIGPNKLNTATFFGGPLMLLNAVNGLFGTDIHYFMQVDIPTTVSIIDSLGGVDVYVNEDEQVIVNASAGINHFNGERAQSFMRDRDFSINQIESNQARNDRQLRVLSALLAKLPNMTIHEAMNMLRDIPALIKTNMTMRDLLQMVQAMLQGDLTINDLNYMRTPSGTYKSKRVNMHIVIEVEGMQDEAQKVRDFLLYP